MGSILNRRRLPSPPLPPFLIQAPLLPPQQQQPFQPLSPLPMYLPPNQQIFPSTPLTGFQPPPFPGGFQPPQPYPGGFQPPQPYPGGFQPRLFPGRFQPPPPFPGGFQPPQFFPGGFQPPTFPGGFQPPPSFPGGFQSPPFPGGFQPPPYPGGFQPPPYIPPLAHLPPIGGEYPPIGGGLTAYRPSLGGGYMYPSPGGYLPPGRYNDYSCGRCCDCCCDCCRSVRCCCDRCCCECCCPTSNHHCHQQRNNDCLHSQQCMPQSCVSDCCVITSRRAAVGSNLEPFIEHQLPPPASACSPPTIRRFQRFGIDCLDFEKLADVTGYDVQFLHQLHKDFKRFAVNDGITRQQFSDIVDTFLGGDTSLISRSKQSALFSQLDVDGDGCIDFVDFVSSYKKLHI